MFTVLPVGAAPPPDRRVLGWFPVVGLVLGALAYVPALAVWRGGPHGSPLLAAVLVVTALALLTRGLHLDGLADLADGLGSRRPPAEALAIMRRPEVGAFGVAALCAVLLTDVAALAAVLGTACRLSGLVVVLAVVVTGRVAAAAAAVGAAAPGSALGALVAGRGPRGLRPAMALAVTALAPAARYAAGGSAAATAWTAAGVIAGLLAGRALRRHAVRRLGGFNGDMLGAVVEIATTASLLVLAAGVAWQ